MKWNHRSKKTVNNRLSSIVRRSLIEPLENRQLLSATVDLRIAGGGKTATVTSVGQVINLDVWVVIAGQQSGSNDGFQSVTGSFLGSPTTSGSIIGNMSSHVTQDYSASGAQDGTSVDLNGDGGLDVGSNDNRFIAGFFYPRAGGIQQNGIISGNSQSFLVGTVSYTVTKLNSGGATDLNFRVRNITGGAFEAVWEEDGKFVTDESASLLTGSPVVISNGQNVPQGSIAGTVFKTVNGSTSGFAATTVYLDNNNNGSLDGGDTSLATDSSGGYSFTGLIAGTYHVREVVPAGFTQTSPSSSTINVTLSAGQNQGSENFTDTANSGGGNTASIIGTVFKSVNGSTSAFAGVTVYLDLNNNGLHDSNDPTATTTSSGTYYLTGLPAGTYHLREVVPSGYNQTSPTSSPTDVTVSNGQHFTGDNFTDTASTSFIPGIISGVVYNDANQNGSFDSGEKTLSGVVVYLDLNKNGKLDPGEATYTTSSNGSYFFGNLPGGNYRVRELVPNGQRLTNPSAGFYDIFIASNFKVSGQNWGNVPISNATGSISGFAFSDANGDGKWQSSEKGLAGVTIYIDANKNGSLDSGEIRTTTGANGSYSFAGLPAGTYRIREVIPSGKRLTTTAYFDVTLGSGFNIGNKNFGDQ